MQRELREANAALARAAMYDSLTNLPNRALFLERLGETLARAQRSDDLVGVLFIDLDDFKAVNDRYGHQVGDQLLQTVAARLECTLRTGDTVARMGGDEFTVVLTEVADQSQALQIADRVRSAIEAPIELGGHELVIHGSVGVARGLARELRIEQILHAADSAMYRAKAEAKIGVAA